MPNRDGTGPQKNGNLTGRGMGSCQSEGKQGQNLPFSFGQGRRCGKGMKKGCGNRWTRLQDIPVEESVQNCMTEK